MQETRKQILEILKGATTATVDEIVAALMARRGKEITAVTVRHHLNILQQEGYITEPQLRHRSTPGRPQHLYTLTEKAQALFPNNYRQLVVQLIEQMNRQLPNDSVNVILEGVADNMAASACIPNVSWEERLQLVECYLNEQGYEASWEQTGQGYVLHTRNCPYHEAAREHENLCSMDLRLIAALIGVVPRRVSRIADGSESCAYLIPAERVRSE